MIERCGIVDEVANGEGGEKMALHQVFEKGKELAGMQAKCSALLHALAFFNSFYFLFYLFIYFSFQLFKLVMRDLFRAPRNYQMPYAFYDGKV